jgi:molybdopterin biosynthesis enzyme MoaB
VGKIGGSLADMGKEGQKIREVTIIKDDVLAVIAPTRDRRDSPEAFKTRWKCQGTGISKRPPTTVFFRPLTENSVFQQGFGEILRTLFMRMPGCAVHTIIHPESIILIHDITYKGRSFGQTCP